MSLHTTAAYDAGQRNALAAFRLQKHAGALGTAVGLAGKGMKWLGRAAGTEPVVGPAANAVIGGVGGLAEGVANQGFTAKGLGEGVARAGANIVTGSIPGGPGVAAGVASDLALNKAFAPKAPAGPQPHPMPGAMGTGPLPGMVR